MKYTVKQIDGEWCVVEKDTDDIVADATDRKDAVLQASALNREESNSESKPKFHRGSSYGNKPEEELSEGPVSWGIDRAIDLMYELTDDGQMAKNAYHEAKAKFKLGPAEAEIVLDIWNDSHKSDRSNFIEVETINELSKKTLGSYVKKATMNSMDRTFIAGHRQGQSSANGESGYNSHANELLKKAGKRKQNINKAVDRLTKESDESSDSMTGYKAVFKKPDGKTISRMIFADDWDGAKEKTLVIMNQNNQWSLVSLGEIEVDTGGNGYDEIRSKQVVKAKKDMDSMNESSENYGGGIIPVYHVATDRVGNVTITKDHGGSVYLQGDEATDFKRQMNRMKTNKVPEEKIMHFLSSYDEVMQESKEDIQEAGRTPQGVDEVAVRELVLYAENDGDLYRQSALPIIANLQRKVKKGTYDPELAIKLWRYHADRAAKKYTQEHDGEFSPATRTAAAKEFRDGYDEEVQSVLGESSMTEEDSMQEANGKEQLTPELAKGILNDLEIGDKDFFTLSSSKINDLLDVAKKYGYRKSKYAPGSTARMFLQYIQRLAKKAKREEINELSKDTLGSYIKKAAFDKGMSGFRQGKAVGNAGAYHKRPDKETADAEAKRGHKRMKGIDRAVKKLTSESKEEINESLSLEDTIKSIIKS